MQEQHGNGHQQHHLWATFSDQEEMLVLVIAVDADKWVIHIFQAVEAELVRHIIVIEDAERQAPED